MDKVAASRERLFCESQQSVGYGRRAIQLAGRLTHRTLSLKSTKQRIAKFLEVRKRLM